MDICWFIVCLLLRMESFYFSVVELCSIIKLKCTLVHFWTKKTDEGGLLRLFLRSAYYLHLVSFYLMWGMHVSASQVAVSHRMSYTFVFLVMFEVRVFSLSC